MPHDLPHLVGKLTLRSARKRVNRGGVQGEGLEVAWCACRVGAVRTEGRRACRYTHVARARRRTRIASISHYRAGAGRPMAAGVVVRAVVLSSSTEMGALGLK